MSIDYLGTDVVQDLLDYARTKCPSSYRFQRHGELSVPAADGSADMICAFSLFTHLLHEETYLYLEDARRALAADGRIVFSFLEFGQGTDMHWAVFKHTIELQRTRTLPALNMFIERNSIEAWCRHLGFEMLEFIDGNVGRGGGAPLGQSVAILGKTD